MAAVTIVEPNSQQNVANNNSNNKSSNNNNLLLSETKKLLIDGSTTNCFKSTKLAILKNGKTYDNPCNCNNSRNLIQNNHRCCNSTQNFLKKPLIADLALMDTTADYLLKTPSVPDLLKTPTIGSPIKSAASSSCLHVDDLNTPSMCLNSSTPKNTGQAFFGDEPLLTGI